MKNETDINAYLFYIGKISSFGWVSIYTLSKSVNYIYIFTDKAYPEESRLLPKNIIITKIDKNSFNNALCKITGFRNEKISGYKLCDFKPLWPMIGSEILNKNIENSLSIDIDIIYGDVGNFLKFNKESKAFIGNRGHILGGNKYYYYNLINELDNYFGNKWRSILTAKKNFAFDEFNYMNKFNEYMDSRGKLEYNTDINNKSFDINYWNLNIKNQNNIKAVSFVYRKQKVYAISNDLRETEYSYIHFQKRKVNVSLKNFIEAVDNNQDIFFNLLPDGSIEFDTEVSMQKIYKINNFAWKYSMLKKRILSKISTESIL